MPTVTSLLLNAARMSLALGAAGNGSAVVLCGALFESVLTTLMVEPHLREQLQAAVRDPGMATALARTLIEQGAALDAHLTDPAQVERVCALDRQLTLLGAINDLASRASLSRAALTLSSLELLRPVDMLHIAGANGTPHTILIGASAEGRGECAIPLPGLSYIAQRVAISYYDGTYHPRLRLTTPTATAHDDRPRYRATWVQKPWPAYDLDVYTYKDRLMGRVRTRIHDTLPTTDDQHLRLSFAPWLPMRFLVTDLLDISDGAEVVLVRCIKIVPEPSGDA